MCPWENFSLCLILLICIIKKITASFLHAASFFLFFYFLDKNSTISAIPLALYLSSYYFGGVGI
jgi:hypothetical protein